MNTVLIVFWRMMGGEDDETFGSGTRTGLLRGLVDFLERRDELESKRTRVTITRFKSDERDRRVAPDSARSAATAAVVNRYRTVKAYLALGFR